MQDPLFYYTDIFKTKPVFSFSQSQYILAML